MPPSPDRTEHFDAEDICIVVRDQLTHVLRDRLDDVASGVVDGADIGEVRNSEESLWLPLAYHHPFRCLVSPSPYTGNMARVSPW